MVTYNYLEVEKFKVFYREAGSKDKPTMLLLHGFPSASHMFRDLIPLLENEYHILAPDYPGFGNTELKSGEEFTYTFENLTLVIEEFIEKLEIKDYILYLFDYGAPIGFRIAQKYPDKVKAIVSQNGNTYREGLGKKWEKREEYWENPTLEKRKSFEIAFAPETIKHQYLEGTNTKQVSPDGYTLDISYVSREGNAEIQSDLIYDYRTNVELYPSFQKYLRDYQPPLLAIWGKNDTSFIPEGAEAFKKDLLDVKVELVDSGHFALETHSKEIAESMKKFLKENLK